MWTTMASPLQPEGQVPSLALSRAYRLRVGSSGVCSPMIPFRAGNCIGLALPEARPVSSLRVEGLLGFVFF